ncbi:hypothetical protein ACFFMN_23525 [Planobispora siamensis]|uniref:Uncharacterized protein n=1 Tax=Planobispora siamensis TaxID=936338 RepID=A0A8J3SMU8_9ACTN|nr:hypothetical protein [Planobispora siamensis]GIH95335.1 hypothetical protein Psi01_59650 [Planobispora siamensis]
MARNMPDDPADTGSRHETTDTIRRRIASVIFVVLVFASCAAAYNTARLGGAFAVYVMPWMVAFTVAGAWVWAEKRVRAAYHDGILDERLKQLREEGREGA